MEIIDFLNIPKDDVLLVDDSRRDLFHSTCHLPVVRLQRRTQMLSLALLISSTETLIEVPQ